MPSPPSSQRYDQVDPRPRRLRLARRRRRSTARVEAIAALREAGKRVAFATNNSCAPGRGHVAQALGPSGIQASLSDVVTVGGAMQHLLAETRARPLGVRDRHRVAARQRHRRRADGAQRHRPGRARRGRRDRRHRRRRPTTTSSVATLALRARRRPPRHRRATPPARCPTASGRAPARYSPPSRPPPAVTGQIVGKPEPQLFYTALDRLGEGRTLVVGDRLDTDIAAATAAGLDAALVLSGGMTADRVARAAADGADAAVAGRGRPARRWCPSEGWTPARLRPP